MDHLTTWNLFKSHGEANLFHGILKHKHNYPCENAPPGRAFVVFVTPFPCHWSVWVVLGKLYFTSPIICCLLHWVVLLEGTQDSATKCKSWLFSCLSPEKSLYHFNVWQRSLGERNYWPYDTIWHTWNSHQHHWWAVSPEMKNWLLVNKNFICVLVFTRLFEDWSLFINLVTFLIWRLYD
jgi:hypothetical protein